MSDLVTTPVERAEAEVTPARPERGRDRPAWSAGAVGVVALVAAWWVLALTVFAGGGAVPTPDAVVRQFADGGWAYFWGNASITLAGAVTGFLWGNALALVLAALVLLVPPLEAVVTQLAVVSYCMPLTAIGPIILVIFGGRAPTVFLAAMSVFFTTLIGALLGLRATDSASLDLVAAYGGGRLQQLRRVRAIAAVPSVLAALKLAAPAAMLGAIIGEYLGGVDSGLGVALTAAQQQFDVPRTWALALLTGAIAGLGYALFSLVARFATPWAAGTAGRSS
jgi:ABC-type nitrate/sulfonate/bicarbonate transport system permease component